MLSDLRHAIRALAKSPAFTIVAVATLALCIGANSAIFTVVNSVLLRPLPYPHSDRLVQVYNSYPKSDLIYAGVSIPDYLDRRDRAPSIEDCALYSWESYNLAGDHQPSRALGLRVTPSFFSTLQVQPEFGRAFVDADAKPGNDQVVVLSHAIWQDRFGGRPDALGRTIRLDGEPFEVIGIMPAGFQFPAPEVKLWVPFAFTPAQMSNQERGHEFSEMIARLKPGATAAGLTAECEAIIQQNLRGAEQFRPYVEATGFTGVAKPLLDQTVGDVRAMLWLLQAGVFAALLIGCANVANLLLTRALGRQRELVIRSALGAGRWNLMRQLLVESLVLFLTGGGGGVLVALWGLSAFEAFGLSDLPRSQTIHIDLPVLLFTLGCAAITGLVFGLLPALQASRADAAEALKATGSRTTASRRHRLVRNTLVVTEIALSFMLLATAVLLTRSFHRLSQQSTGFDPESLMTARINLPEHGYDTDAARLAFEQNLLQRVRALPGVKSASLTSNIPFGYGNDQGTYHIEGRQPPPGQPPPHGQLRTVAPGYFQTMQIPLLRGRTFNGHDNADGEQVVIIDRVLADRYWPGQSPLGQHLYRDDNQPGNLRTIIGVVATVKQHGLDDPTIKETLYFPFAQRPVGGFNLVVRTTVPPQTISPQLRQAVQAIDADLPVYDLQTMQARVTNSLLTRRTPMLLLGLFSGMALLLAVLGVYGVLAFNVGQRTQEIGIRMALGALARDVLRLVLRQGLHLITLGLALGLAGYMAASHLLRSLVFGVSTTDPAALMIAALVLATVAAAACLIPARRAARVDPMEALRSE